MKVRRLDGPPYEKVQCQLPKEELSPGAQPWKGYREGRTRLNNQNIDFCMQHARWEIDGQLLCTRHAGAKALEHLVED